MLRLLVLKTARLDETKRFYESLGLLFVEERHGSGPLHYAADVGGCTFELYPSDNEPSDATRLGFAVSGLDGVMEVLSLSGVPIVRPPKSTLWGYRAVVRDPDGRAVELYET